MAALARNPTRVHEGFFDEQNRKFFEGKIVIPSIAELRGYNRLDKGRLEVANDALEEARVFRIHGDQERYMARTRAARQAVNEMTFEGRSRLQKYSRDRNLVTYDIDELAAFLGVEEFDAIRDRNDFYFYESALQSLPEDERFDEEGLPSERLQELEREFMEMMYQHYHGVVLGLADEIFTGHDLTLHVTAEEPKWGAIEWEISPAKTWRDVAREIRKTDKWGGFDLDVSFPELIRNENLNSEKKFRAWALDSLDRIYHWWSMTGVDIKRRFVEAMSR